MDNKPRHGKFWTLALTEIAVAVGASAIWFYFRTAPILAEPPPENGDLYAYNWGFQFIVFLFFWLPPTLLAAGVFLAIQYQFLKPRYSSRQARDSGSAA